MHPELLERIIKLEKQGWETDAEPSSLQSHFQFPSYTETLNFLVEVGSAAERIGEMPSIFIDAGTAVVIRVGQAPMPILSEAEIELAEALTEAA